MSRPRVFLGALALSFLAVGGAEAQPRRRRFRRTMPRKLPTKKPEKKKPEKPKKPDRWFAVHAGWVHTVSGAVRRDVTILAKNGKIFQIGQDLEIPKKAEVLDAKTKHVYPGLIAYSSYGIVGFSPADSTDVFGLNLVMGLSAGLTTVGSGGTIAKLTYGTLEGHLVGRAPRLVRISYRDSRSKRRTRASFEKVRAWMREMRAYTVKKSRGDKEAKPPKPLSGMLASYHKLMQGQGYASVRASSTKAIRDVAHLALKYGFKLQISGGTEAYKVASLLGRVGARVVVVPRGRPFSWGYRPPGMAKLEWSIENAAILHKHGVQVVVMPRQRGIGTWGLAGNDLFTLPLEAAFAVRGGLSQNEALKTITLNPAKFLGVADQVGSIEVGKDCDLVITGGDLLHYQTLPQWTIVNGRIAYDKQKDSLLRHVRPRDLQKGKNLELPQLWPRPKGSKQPEMPKREK